MTGDNNLINEYRERFRRNLTGRWTTAEGTFFLMNESFEFLPDGTGEWQTKDGLTKFQWREKTDFEIELLITWAHHWESGDEDGENEPEEWHSLRYDFKTGINDCGNQVIVFSNSDDSFYCSQTRIGYAGGISTADESIPLASLIGCRITDILVKITSCPESPDECHCFIQLEDGRCVEFPYNKSRIAWLAEPLPGAVSLFKTPPKKPVIKTRRQKLLAVIDRFLTNYEYVRHSAADMYYRKIVDFISYKNRSESEKILILLDNGYVITEQNMAFTGTDKANLHYYTSLHKMRKRNGCRHTTFTGKKRWF